MFTEDKFTNANARVQRALERLNQMEREEASLASRKADIVRELESARQEYDTVVKSLLEAYREQNK